LAYYYFKPYKFKNKFEEHKFQKNRMNAFYNSREHFCRSLFSNRLKENGYVLIEYCVNDSTQNIDKRFVSLDDHIVYKNEKEAQIVGLQGRTFHIFDFFNYSNKPIDMSNTYKFDYTSVEKFWKSASDYGTNKYYFFGKNNSTITFTSDTCTIWSNGIILDNNILFAGKMIKKKVDALIPDIYLKE